jgi:hypothetical protein
MDWVSHVLKLRNINQINRYTNLHFLLVEHLVVQAVLQTKRFACLPPGCWLAVVLAVLAEVLVDQGVLPVLVLHWEQVDWEEEDGQVLVQRVLLDQEPVDLYLGLPIVPLVLLQA